jgi:hypothetical protein
MGLFDNSSNEEAPPKEVNDHVRTKTAHDDVEVGQVKQEATYE